MARTPRNRPVPATPPVLKPGDQVGQYEIVEPLANGGMGSVYKVRCGEGWYVLKLLTLNFLDEAESSESQREQRTRAKRELVALELLEHRNIVRVYGSGMWPEPRRGWFYIVMEFVDGADIASWREEERPSLRQILAALEGVARALEEVHRGNLQHRDVKVENVLVRRGTGVAVLIDFGVARHGGLPAVTQRAEIVGTETNYAPEYVKYMTEPAAARGPYPWGASEDLWGFGCVFYEVVTGRRPFSAHQGRDALLSAIMNDPVTDAREVNPAVPEPVAKLVMRLLEKDRAARPGNAAEVGDALRDMLAVGGDELDQPFSVPPLDREEGEGVEAPALIAPGLPAWCREQMVPGGSEDGGEEEYLRQVDRALEPVPAEELGPAKVELDEDGSAPPTPTDKTAKKGSGITSAIEKMEKRVAASSPRRWLSWRLAAVALGLVACGLVLGMARSDKPAEKDDMLARLEREQKGGGQGVSSRGAPVVVELGAFPSAAPRLSTPEAPRLSASDAANIDAALAARYGRPTVPPAGSALPEATPPIGPPVAAAVSAAGNGETRSAAGDAPPTARAGRGVAKPAVAGQPDGRFVYAVLVEEPAPGQADAGPRKFGIAMGTHIRARLVSNLDSRTIGSGPVEAVLPYPLVVRGKEILPARTALYGRASENMGRFNIQFTRLRLPDDTEIEFEGLAMDRGDNKPGLAAGARIIPEGYQEEGLGTRIARGTGNTILNTVTGGVGADVMRGAGSSIVNHRASSSAGGAEVPTILLDAGGLFDVFVSKSF